jgi:hypothetical protein
VPGFCDPFRLANPELAVWLRCIGTLVVALVEPELLLLFTSLTTIALMSGSGLVFRRLFLIAKFLGRITSVDPITSYGNLLPLSAFLFLGGFPSLVMTGSTRSSF